MPIGATKRVCAPVVASSAMSPGVGMLTTHVMALWGGVVPVACVANHDGGRQPNPPSARTYRRRSAIVRPSMSRPKT
jgi:hypothetical protein